MDLLVICAIATVGPSTYWRHGFDFQLDSDSHVYIVWLKRIPHVTKNVTKMTISHYCSMLKGLVSCTTVNSMETLDNLNTAWDSAWSMKEGYCFIRQLHRKIVRSYGQHVSAWAIFHWNKNHVHIQWGAKPLQCLTPDQGMKCPAINCGNFTLLWWEQIKYKPLAIPLSPWSCDFAYILQRYIYFKTPILLQQFCTLYSLHWNQVLFGYVWSYKQTYTY